MRQVNQDWRHHLLSLSKRLDDIVVEKRALLLRLESLESEERALTRERASLHNLNAPTSNCPDEILAMIFEAGMPARLGRGSQVHDFGVIASHVSQRWRRIALSTPNLWTLIQCFRLSLFASKERKHWRERAAVFLSRSRISPVHIHISGRGLSMLTQATDFLDLISGHTGHCHQLCIEGVPAETMLILLEAISRQPVPLLRSVRLKTWDSVGFQHPFLSLGAPRLTTVDLTGMDPLSFHFCTLAFASVTSLQLNALGMHDEEQYASFRNALMNMAALTHLELRLFLKIEPVQPIVLPNLRSLAVDMELDGPSQSIILKFIHAPSLISLSLTGWDPEEEPLSVVGQTHFPALQHLILGSYIIDAILEFGVLAKSFPNIECLTCRVQEGEEIGAIIANITEPGDELRWPKLQSIAVSDVYRTLDAEELGYLCQLIIKLQQAGRPFRQLVYPISVSCTPLAGAGDINKLREVVELEDFVDDWPTPFESSIWRTTI